MKGRKVSAFMLPYVEFVLKRDNIPYAVEGISNEVVTNLSSRQFTVVVNDALCEVQRQEAATKCPVYSLKTLRNKEKFARLQRLNGTNAFRIFYKDREIFEKLG